MDAVRLDIIAQWSGGELTAGSPETVIERVVTDSRAARAGDLFVAIEGPRYDGHDFAVAAAEAGAAAIVVSKPVIPSGGQKGVLAVPNTLDALGEIARHYRQQFSIPVAGVTGSSGKTTTKEFLSAILRSRFKTVSNAGNLNNLIGLPLSVLGLSREAEAAVFEMGMSLPGEIARLSEIAAPTLGIITMVGPCHMATLRTVAAVREAKAELIDYLNRSNAPVVLDAGHEHFEFLRSRATGGVITVSIDGTPAEYEARGIVSKGINGSRFTLRDKEFTIPLPGRHNAANALMAVAAAERMGVDLDAMIPVLANFSSAAQSHRLVPRRVNGVLLLDDCYNANPMSFEAALSLAAETPLERDGQDHKKVLVMGDMLELGENSPAYHRRVGEQAAKAGINLLIHIGEESLFAAEAASARGMTTIPAKNQDEVLNAMRDHLRPGDLVLVKGSHGMALDQVVEHYARMEE